MSTNKFATTSMELLDRIEDLESKQTLSLQLSDRKQYKANERQIEKLQSILRKRHSLKVC